MTLGRALLTVTVSRPAVSAVVGTLPPAAPPVASAREGLLISRWQS